MESGKPTPPVSPVLVILLGILAVSTASIFIRFAQAEAHSLVIAASRLTIASLILAPITLPRHGGVIRSLTRRETSLGVLSGLFLAIHFATWITSLAYTSVTSSIVLVQTMPLWVAIMAPIFLREPIGRRVVTGLALALAGGLIVSLADSCQLAAGSLDCSGWAELVRGDAFIGNLLALAGAISGGAYLIIGKSLRLKLPTLPYIFIVYGVAALALLAAMVAYGYSPLGYSPVIYVWFVLLALVPQLLGHSSFNWALGYLPAAVVSITFLGEPIGTIILAAVLLNERPSMVKLTGAFLILAGIYISSRQPAGKRGSRRKPGDTTKE